MLHDLNYHNLFFMLNHISCHIPSFSLVHVISLGSLNLGRPKAYGASTITVLSCPNKVPQKSTLEHDYFVCAGHSIFPHIDVWGFCF